MELFLKILNEMANGVDPSGLGLHCLHMPLHIPLYQIVWCSNVLDIYHMFYLQTQQWSCDQGTIPSVSDNVRTPLFRA